jgi:hypothetical protein
MSFGERVPGLEADDATGENKRSEQLSGVAFESESESDYEGEDWLTYCEQE